MNNSHRVIPSKPDLAVIEFRPPVAAHKDKPEPIAKPAQEPAKQEDIFDWLSSH